MSRIAHSLLLTIALVQPAFAQEGTGSGAGEPHLPPPFTADVLSQSFSVGETWQFRLTQDPEPPMTVTLRVVTMRDDGVEIESRVTTDAGEDVAAPSLRFSTWAELESHAHYPQSTTEVEPLEVSVPAGTFSGVRYRAVEADGAVVEATFATELPGPPVRYVETREGSPGMSMELLSHTEGTEAPAE